MRPTQLAVAGTALVLLAAFPAAAPADQPEAPPRLVLALSGGGARGFAHIGVIQALEECGIRPDAIAGTSMGALVGGLYALGYSSSELVEVAVRPDWAEVFLGRPGDKRDRAVLRQDTAGWPLLRIELDRGGLRVPAGIVPTERLGDLLARLVLAAAGTTDFAATHIPLRVVAADLVTGSRVVLDSGSLVRALRASMAVPGLFSPAEIDGRLLTDGGLVENLPVATARELGGALVVAVDVTSPLRTRAELDSFLAILDQSLSFAISRGVEESRAAADLVIAPALRPGTNAAFDPADVRDLIACGREAGLAACPLLQALVSSHQLAFPSAIAPPRVRELEVERVVATGASGSAERLARRLFGPLPDDGRLSLDEVERRVGRVRASAVFDDVAVSEVSGGTLALRVEVEPPFRLRLSARYDDKTKVLGRLAASLQSAGAGLRELVADVIFGEVIHAALEARHERVLGGTLRIALRGIYDDEFDRLVVANEDLGKLRVERVGGEARADLALGRRGLGSLGWRLESVLTRAQADSATVPALPDLGRERHAFLFARLLLDGTDRYHYPTAGGRFVGRLAVARQGLGGDRDYSRLDLLAETHRTWRDRSTLSLRLRASGGLGGELPLPEQPAAGGNEPFPGYRRDELRGQRLAAAEVAVRHLLFALPTTFGRGFLIGAQAGAGSVDGGVAELTGGGRLAYGVGLLAAFDTRVGPIEGILGFGRGGRRRVTVVVGPRF